MTGLLLVLLGAWGALIPFIGPTFTYGYTPNTSWDWNSARFWYEVLPGAVTVAGALLLLLSANRLITMIGAWAAALSGAWFIIGPVLAPQLGLGNIGRPIGGTGWTSVWESIGLFFGLGALILHLASVAIGRLTVKGVRDVRADERHHQQDHSATTTPTSDSSHVRNEEVVKEGRQTQDAPTHIGAVPSDGAKR